MCDSAKCPGHRVSCLWQPASARAPAQARLWVSLPVPPRFAASADARNRMSSGGGGGMQWGLPSPSARRPRQSGTGVWARIWLGGIDTPPPTPLLRIASPPLHQKSHPWPNNCAKAWGVQPATSAVAEQATAVSVIAQKASADGRCGPKRQLPLGWRACPQYLCRRLGMVDQIPIDQRNVAMRTGSQARVQWTHPRRAAARSSTTAMLQVITSNEFARMWSRRLPCLQVHGA